MASFKTLLEKAAGSLILTVLTGGLCGAAPQSPNIVLIVADDLGYGDVGVYNPDSRIPTPHLDRLASQGMRFTAAHAPGALCVPSRYGLLTGRYPFRQSLSTRQGPVIEAGRMTLASLLRQKGYRTAMVGKWHQGFEGGERLDCSRPLRGGPVDRGFDSFFGMHASLDIPPYFYVDNDRCVSAPSGFVEASSSPGWSPIQGAFWRAGPMAPDFKHQEVQEKFTRKSVEFLQSHHAARPSQPFFLYLALAAPHTPWLPDSEFQNRSGAGEYGDFVVQVDAAIGRLLDTLALLGQEQGTMVIFTSDNGPVWYEADEKRFGHAATGGFRGMKGDAWEGGHRMPFLVRWPGRVAAGSQSEAVLSFTDLLATFADIVQIKLPDSAGEDSWSFLPVLSGESASIGRAAVVAQSSRGYLSVQDEEWKLITGLGSGGFTQPAQIEPEPGGVTGQLYNLRRDPGERENLFREKPEVVGRLTEFLERIRQAGRSRPSDSPAPAGR